MTAKDIPEEWSTSSMTFEQQVDAYRASLLKLEQKVQRETELLQAFNAANRGRPEKQLRNSSELALLKIVVRSLLNKGRSNLRNDPNGDVNHGLRAASSLNGMQASGNCFSTVSLAATWYLK